MSRFRYIYVLSTAPTETAIAVTGTSPIRASRIILSLDAAKARRQRQVFNISSQPQGSRNLAFPSRFEASVRLLLVRLDGCRGSIVGDAHPGTFPGAFWHHPEKPLARSIFLYLLFLLLELEAASFCFSLNNCRVRSSLPFRNATLSR